MSSKDRKQLNNKVNRIRIEKHKRQRRLKKLRKKVAVSVIPIITTIALVIGALNDSIGILQFLPNKIQGFFTRNKITKIVNSDNEDGGYSTMEPISAGSFVAVNEVCPNEDIPAIFSFTYEYNLQDLRNLDISVHNEISQQITHILARTWENGSYDDPKILIANEIERQLMNESDDLSDDMKEEMHNNLVNDSIYIYSQTGSSLTAITLGQRQQNLAAFLLSTYNDIDNEDKNNQCVENSLKSVENFILGMSYEDVAKNPGDILYRMALDYENIAEINKNNMEDKCKAYVMANALYKISIDKEDDNNHGNEAYYNLGRNYVSLHLLVSISELFGNYQNLMYCAEQAYNYLHEYMKKESAEDLRNKAIETLIPVCEWLAINEFNNTNYVKANKYLNERKQYIKQYQKSIK